LPRGRDNEVEILHWNSAQQNFFTENEGTDEAGTVLEANLDRANVIEDVPLAVGGRDFALLNGLQTELQYNVLRQKEVERTRIDERLRFERREAAIERITNFNRRGN
jgi:hypothetical protein